MKKEKNRKPVLAAINFIEFSVIFFIILISLTIEDLFHNISIAEALKHFHHFIIPFIVGIIGSIFTHKFRVIRQREKRILKGKQNIIEKITESDSYFKTLMEQTPSVIEIYDTTGLQIAVNKAYEKLWSFPASTTVNSFNVLRSKEVEKTGLLEYIKKAYAGELVTAPEYEFNPQGETESKGFGRNRWLSTTVFPLKDAKGKVKNIVITHEDISERKYAEEKILKAMAKAEESDKLKTMFLANLSHEIRTPMNGILGFAELLKNPDLIAEKHNKYLEVIKKSGERMLYIIDELIDISQIESGGLKLRNGKFACTKQLNY